MWDNLFTCYKAKRTVKKYYWLSADLLFIVKLGPMVANGRSTAGSLLLEAKGKSIVKKIFLI